VAKIKFSRFLLLIGALSTSKNETIKPAQSTEPIKKAPPPQTQEI
jgi:hypothetical protein